MNILLINAHQKYDGFAEGKLNKTIFKVIKDELENSVNQIKITNIEAGYDIAEEIKKHIWADIIVIQSPVYWFGAPWIYKKYIDEVFTTALVQSDLIVDDGRTRKDPTKQYGTGGKMQGKKIMLSLTWNAPENAFEDEKQKLFEGKTVDDVFLSHTSVYKFCGAEVLPSFSFYDVVKNIELKNGIEKLKLHLKKHLLN